MYTFGVVKSGFTDTLDMVSIYKKGDIRFRILVNNFMNDGVYSIIFFRYLGNHGSEVGHYYSFDDVKKRIDDLEPGLIIPHEICDKLISIGVMYCLN